MKNISYKRMAIILSVIVVGLILFGFGYSMGAMDTAKFLINQVIRIMEYEEIFIDITKVELFEYYIKLKGGG